MDGVEDIMRAIAGTTDDPLVALDAGGTVVFADDEVLSLFGRSQAELGRFSLDEVLREADLSWAAQALGRMVAGAPVAVPGHFVVTGPDGNDVAFVVYPLQYDAPTGDIVMVALLRPTAS
jgi:PAS domain-containing protein